MRERASNFELLRIVSMLMVLNVHTYSVPDSLHFLTNGGGYLRTIIEFFRESSSISCVNLFVLISGYFSIKWKVKSISALIFQVYFWIFLIYIVCISTGLSEFSIKGMVSRSMGIMNGYWFISAYIGLYIFAPLLNSFCENSSLKQLGLYIIVFYIFFTIDAMPFSSNYSSHGYSIYSFCGLYLIGQYLRKSNIMNLSIFGSKFMLFCYILIVTLIIAICALGLELNVHKVQDLQLFPLSPFAYNNPLVILQSILIFILFSKIIIKNNIINWIATGSLAMYLLHMHPDLKQYYYEYSEILYDYPLTLHYLSILLLFLSVAIIAIPIDKLREFVFKKCYSWIISMNKSIKE